MNGVRLNLHADRFKDSRTKRQRTRSAQFQAALAEEVGEEPDPKEHLIYDVFCRCPDCV